MRRIAMLIFTAAVASACVRDEKKDEPTAAAPSASGRLRFANQPWLRGSAAPAAQPGEPTPPTAPGAGSETATDGREIETGYRLHDQLAPGCSDKKCLSDGCARLCTQWIGENYTSYRSTSHRNQVRFNCLGACWGGRPEAGK